MIRRIVIAYLLLLNVLPATASTSWHVDSDYQRELVQRYLNHLWPEHPFTVVTTPHPATGVWYRNGTLTFSTESQTIKEPMVWDVVQMIGAVRDWHHSAKVVDTGWAPEVPVPVPRSNTPSTPTPDAKVRAPPFPVPVQLQIGVNGHFGRTAVQNAPSAHIAALFPFYVRSFRVAPFVGVDLFRRLRLDPLEFDPNLNPFWIHHFEMSLFGAWSPNSTLEVTLRTGCRVYTSQMQTSYSTTRSPFIPTATFALGLRVWLRSVSKFRFGVHASASSDVRTDGVWIANMKQTPFQIRTGIVSQFGKNKKN